MSWYLDTDNRLNHADLAKEGGNGFVYPYPYMFWDYISDTDKTLTLNHGEFKPMRYAIVDEEENRNDNQMLTPPYPSSFWYLDENNKLMNAMLPNELLPDFGCFRHATNLKIVSIPLSVMSVDTHSFSDTSLKRAHLADNCTYYNTSFPENCEVSGGQLIEEGD